MSEILRGAFEEAQSQAARLPSEAVAVVIFTFAADGTCAPVLAAEPEAVPMVAGRLMDVTGAMLDELTGDCHEEPPASSAEMVQAERIAAQAIKRAAKR